MTSLADLDTMDRSALAALWSDVLGGEVPPKMSQPMQRRFIGFALQVQEAGDLAPALAARLDRIAAGEDRKATPALKPGGRLLRAWNGTTHVVDVLPDGYLWNGARHRSLSAIARAITGARWSGPRFFGLTAGEPGANPKLQRGIAAAGATQPGAATPVRRARHAAASPADATAAAKPARGSRSTHLVGGAR